MRSFLQGIFGKPARTRNVRPLIAVLRDAQTLLARADNNFGFSPWSDATQASTEIEMHIKAFEHGRATDDAALSLLFAPTGAIQEVSVSSGWGDEFIALASRFDDAFVRT